MARIVLPTRSRGLETYDTGPASAYPAKATGALGRTAYAAAHVVANPTADIAPWLGSAIDWDATIAFRHHLWGLGFKIAEAMDTSQRSMGLSWDDARELIRRSIEASRDVPGADLACGAGTDQLAAEPGVTLDQVVRAYEEQLE